MSGFLYKNWLERNKEGCGNGCAGLTCYIIIFLSFYRAKIKKIKGITELSTFSTEKWELIHDLLKTGDLWRSGEDREHCTFVKYYRENWKELYCIKIAHEPLRISQATYTSQNHRGENIREKYKNHIMVGSFGRSLVRVSWRNQKWHLFDMISNRGRKLCFYDGCTKTSTCP